jgi:hypothetical protein
VGRNPSSEDRCSCPKPSPLSTPSTAFCSLRPYAQYRSFQ